ncbi:hypothetical protein Pelo_3445 [Pelomyxa schiedti]|nr:hypothetical protein Pelo_3445 [Pelomyxa schiedti]
MPGSGEFAREVGVHVDQRRILLRFLKSDLVDREWQAMVAGARPSSLEISSTKKDLPSKYDEEMICFGAIWFYSLDFSKKVFVFCNGEVINENGCIYDEMQIGFCCVDSCAPTPPHPPHKLLKPGALSAPWIPLAKGSPSHWRLWGTKGSLQGSSIIQQLMDLSNWQLPREEEEPVLGYLDGLVSLCGCREYFQEVSGEYETKIKLFY